uniref:Spondin domain-containing protein n=1 Tax=Rhodosorus marinus TaxID=101924 RepID=A0A7S0BFR4_9RHOD|mmetsp:Transcript_11770/g.17043  ORF Transcript_11770/g.17043 Transcript_11770/m.17043 type:complete len:323 (+) Transcript_11770:175-1143(+)
MKSIYVVALFACVAGAFGQMNAGLTVSAVATWSPIPEITIESSGFECASEAIIDNEVADMPDLDFSFPYKLYPPSSVNFGSSCSAGDANSASIVVVDSENVGSVPGLVSSLEVVLEDGTVGPILELVLGFPKSATWYFNQATTCSSGFESSANSTGSTPTDPLSNPVGVVFSAQSDMPVINGFEFVPGLRYFHYVIMDSSGAVGAFCSYSRFTGETPSPTSVPPSGTETPIMTGTETEMPTGTGMETGTETEMPTGTGTETATPTTMETETPTTMETATPTMTPTLDPSMSESVSESISESISESVSESISASESASERLRH